jgi:hypothetical protein
MLSFPGAMHNMEIHRDNIKAIILQKKYTLIVRLPVFQQMLCHFIGKAMAPMKTVK